MTRLSAGGIALTAPPGWDVRMRAPAARAANVDGSSEHLVVHAASFVLPEGRGDFGGDPVMEAMGGTDVFVALLEYGPESVGTALFARRGVPRALPASAFAPGTMHRPTPGMAGSQTFCSEAGRAFCLYAVIGSWAQRVALAARLGALLAGMEIGPR